MERYGDKNEDTLYGSSTDRYWSGKAGESG